MDREKKIIRTSIIGILANVLLAAFKAVVGLASSSVAIVLDAVNNLSDALSSLITIIGTKLAGKDPDRKHPLGYGRIEYLSAVIIAAIVLYAGITSLVESVKKILHPATPDYAATALIIVAAAVLVKIILGRYVKHVGEKVNSDSLVASGKDAMFDSVLSASTLLAAIIYITTGIRLEAWLGAVIAIVIIKAGFDMLRETISEILGERADAELVRDVRRTIASFPEVRGAYDLILHNYGPNKLVGSVHIEVPDTMNAVEMDQLDRAITARVYQEHGIAMTGISVYSFNTGNDAAAQMRSLISSRVLENPDILQVHGFYVNEAEHTITFDIVIDFDAKDKKETCRAITEMVQEMYPDYRACVTLDYDMADL